MTSKALTTRKTNALAGTRPPLPGHDHNREASLRAELAAWFAPEGPVEMIWVGDIAYCSAAIETIRAQIAGFWMLKVKEAAKAIPTGDVLNEQGAFPRDYDLYSAEDREWLKTYAAQNFTAPWQQTYLSHSPFSMLLGAMNRSDVRHLRWLQEAVHHEMQERDRIINQFERRRRQAMRDAIELVEAERRAATATTVPAGDGQNPALPEPAAINSIGNYDGIAADRALGPSGARTGDGSGAIEDDDTTAIARPLQDASA